MGGDDVSASVELSGPTDPVRLGAQHEVDLVRRVLSVVLVVYNRLPIQLAGLTVR